MRTRTFLASTIVMLSAGVATAQTGIDDFNLLVFVQSSGGQPVLGAEVTLEPDPVCNGGADRQVGSSLRLGPVATAPFFIDPTTGAGLYTIRVSHPSGQGQVCNTDIDVSELTNSSRAWYVVTLTPGFPPPCDIVC